MLLYFLILTHVTVKRKYTPSSKLNKQQQSPTRGVKKIEGKQNKEK